MAAPIRIRVANLEFGNYKKAHSIDPFWLLVDDNVYPLISDVETRIKSICKDCSTFQYQGTDTDSADDNFSSEDHTRNNAACQIWLDGCRLLSSEKTTVLRENDSVTVKFTQNDVKSRARKSLLDKLSISASSVSQTFGSNCMSLIEEGNVTLKRKRRRNLKDDEDINGTRERSSSKAEKRLKKKRKKEKDCDTTIDDSNLSLPIEKKNKHKKELKERKEKSKSKKSICDEESERPVVTYSIAGDTLQPVKHCGDEFGIEEMKRKLLSKVEDLVKVGDCPTQHDMVGNGLTTSNDVSLQSDGGTEKKKRRRRRKKKGKKVLDSAKPVKVEDKPRSSTLNLPWDQQPQNMRQTFESEESCDDEDGGDQSGQEDEGRKDIVKDIFQDVQASKSNNKEICNTETMEIGHGVESSGCNRQGKVLEKSHDSPPAMMPYKSKKFLLRSTGCILDSLKPTPSPVMESNTTVSSSKTTTPDMNKGESRTRTRSDFSAAKPEYSTGNTNSPRLLPRGLSSADEKPVSKAKELSIMSRPTKSVTSITSPSPVPDLTNSMSSGPSISTAVVTKPSLLSQKTSKPIGTCVDSDSKFHELLQRRRLNNSTCTVSTSQNGITICSRNKNQKWNGNVDAYVNPANDVLTNKSTIIKVDGDSKCASSRKLSNSSGMTSPSPGLCGPRITNNMDGDGSGQVEVIPLDIENCPPLKGYPQQGDVIAYKILEMGEDYTPSVSDFKTGRVLAIEKSSAVLELFGTSVPKRKTGKFDLVYDDMEEEQDGEMDDQNDNQVSVDMGDLMDARLVQGCVDR